MLKTTSVTYIVNFCYKLGGYWRGTWSVLGRKYSKLWKIFARIRLLVENKQQKK